MTTTFTPLDSVRAAAEETHEELLALVTDLLDAYSEAYPYSSTFGCDYEAPNGQPDGRIVIDPADDGEGVNYIARFHPDPDNPRGDDEDHWLFGKYGWMGPNELVNERPFFRQVIDEAVEREYLAADALDRFDAAFERLDDALQTAREATTLEDIATLIEDHETETLRTLLATGDEEGRVVWSLLHSKDENGDTIENDVAVPVISERDGLMLVRAERFFHDEYREPDGKYYAYGAVIGIDDTSDVFFVHRLESDPDLRDPETEWTIGLLKEKMGFDMHHWEWVEAGKPHDVIVRAQGDLAFVRRDYRSKLWEHYESVYETECQRLVNEHLPRYSRDDPTELSERLDAEFGDIDSVSVPTHGSFRNIPAIYADSTDDLKVVQGDLGIDEETVRDEQERRGIQRLTANRRKEIVEDLVRERVIGMACDIEGTTNDDLQAEADATARDQFGETVNQVNAVLGNHTVIVGPAREHPDDQYDRTHDCLMAVVVPEEANGVVWHDEHEVPELELPPGVYEFQFLRGYEDEWWMSN